ncbi:MAG TPA: alpha/beta hydrolase-fold protein [Candidatus Acidoferrum sp.]|nr:alpha/beta hydrolase-fold protein [Candidatus Acidoferrum sp.]
MTNERFGGGISWAILIFLCCPVFAAAASARIECKPLPSRILGHPVNYCAVLPPSYDSDKARKFPVLYFFHGLGDNEQMFVHGGAFNLVQDLWERKEIGEFLIVTPEAGATFYINSHSGKVRYEDFLVQEFLPAIESRYRIHPGRANRGVSGVSMGGYGALHLGFRHPELFAAVSAHSPALIDRIPAVASPSAGSGMRSRVLGETFGSPPDPAFWQRNSPMTLARTANLSGLKIYFDCGEQDDYGFEEGAKSLDKILGSRHTAHEAHIYPGRHDWQYFAEHLPASLQFQSRNFFK